MAKAQVGARTAGAISSVIAETLTKHKAVSLPVEKAAQAKLLRVLMEDAEGVWARTLRDILGELATDPSLPPEARKTLRILTSPSHQWQLLLGAAGVIGLAFGIVQAAGQPWVQATAQAANRKDPNVMLTPEQLAEAFVRGVMNGPDATAEARSSGIAPDRFATLAALAGEPPAIEQLLLLYRRGQISKSRLEHGIHQSRVRDEWVDAVEALRFAPLAPSIAVDAAVQAQASRAQAQKLAAEGGLAPEHFDLAFRVAGRPPGIVEMIELWQRGEVAEHDVRQTIAESDVKTKYTDALLKLRRRLLPADTIASMVGDGVLTDRQAIGKLMEHGYNHEDAAAWIDKHHQTAAKTQREATRSEILALYEARTITRARALQLMEAARYQRDLAALDLDLVDSKRLRQFQTAAIARVHSLYVAFRIERPDMVSLLDRLGVPADQVRELTRVWDLERQANTRDLTKAEIVSAYVRDIFTLAEAHKRLAGIGYRGEDAAVILAEHAPAPARERTLSAAQVVAQVKRGNLTAEVGRVRLVDLGYSGGDAALLLSGI